MPSSPASAHTGMPIVAAVDARVRDDHQPAGRVDAVDDVRHGWTGARHEGRALAGEIPVERVGRRSAWPAATSAAAMAGTAHRIFLAVASGQQRLDVDGSAERGKPDADLAEAVDARTPLARQEPGEARRRRGR